MPIWFYCFHVDGGHFLVFGVSESLSQNTHRTHLHHPKLGAGEIRPKSKLMDTESLTLVKQCGKANVLTSSTSNLIAERTNLRFVKEQIDYILRRDNAERSTTSETRSAVDALVAYLESR
ncbi:MAG: hypothetical protein ACREOZ_05225 [Gloeomargaritales cyanobacterium]